MALKLVEFFGHSPEDRSLEAKRLRKKGLCPFIQSDCTKTFRDGVKSGACAVQQTTSGPIICCPNRLYADDYRVLLDVATTAFGNDVVLVSAAKVKEAGDKKRKVVAFGKRWGKELKLPRIEGRGGYFVDWILALVDGHYELQEFVAVEIQSIDTTGTYRPEVDAYLRGERYPLSSNAGMNWENVHKRILPQIIYKGHVLRRERLCRRGMFFVCPAPVYMRIWERLGKGMLPYENLQPGSLTLMWYDLGPAVPEGERRRLVNQGRFSTTIDQVALAFTAPTNLPPANVYEKAIRLDLRRR